MMDERRLFFEVSLDLLCVAGRDGYLKNVNSTCEKVLGYPRKELLGVPFMDFVYPEDQGRVKEVLLRLYRGEEIRSFECRSVCKDGSLKWITWNCRFFGDRIYASGRAKLVESSKETSFREHEVLRTHSSKMAALEEIAGGLAHEINNPLTAIVLNAAIIKDFVSEDQLEKLNAHRILSKIEENSFRISSVIKKLGEVSDDWFETPHEK